MDAAWQTVLCIVTAILLCLLMLKVYVQWIKGICVSNVQLDGKTAIVTGANTGIGYWTALELARRNGRVILACRDLQKGQAAVDKIIDATQNRNVLVKQLDVSLMRSIRAFAADIIREETRLDILVNNAGIAGLPKTMTEEGFELTYATNHFGPFLLTNLLLGLLQKSQPSRIVTVTSWAHSFILGQGMFFDNLKAEKWYNIGKFYFSSKLANILFTRELSRRLEGTGVTANCVHPGVVSSRLLRHVPCLVSAFMWAISCYHKTPEEGAQTSIYCAVSEDLCGVSGRYFSDCRDTDTSATAASRDMGVATKLWEISEQYTQLAHHQQYCDEEIVNSI